MLRRRSSKNYDKNNQKFEQRNYHVKDEKQVDVINQTNCCLIKTILYSLYSVQLFNRDFCLFLWYLLDGPTKVWFLANQFH